jgi:hypothetical protein
VRYSRWLVSLTLVPWLLSLVACSGSLGVSSSGGAGQGQMPASIVVFFNSGFTSGEVRLEVETCHPLHISGIDTVRHHGQTETSAFIWGPPSGTAKAKALYYCIKGLSGEAEQSWAG